MPNRRISYVADGVEDQIRGMFRRRPAVPPALLAMAVVDSVGTGLYLTGAVLYFDRVVGLSAGEIGLGLTLAGACGLLATVPIGVLADSYGVRRVLVALQLWRTGWLFALLAVPDAPAFVLVSCLLGLAVQAVPPLNQTLVAAATGEERAVHAMAVTRAIRNVGFGVGAGAGTLLLTFDTAAVYRGLVAGNALSFALVALLVARVALVAPPANPLRRRRRVRAFLRDERPYLALAGVNGVLSIHMTLLSLGLPLWISAHTDAPRWAVGAVVLLNTVLAVLLQVPAARGCESPAVAVRRARAAGLSLAGCCVVAGVAAGLPPAPAVGCLLVAALLLTLGELWQAGAGWGLSFAFAPAEQRAVYLSTFSLGTAAQAMAGPALVAAAIANGWPGWVALGAVFLLAGALAGPPARRLAARRPADAPLPVAG